MITEDYVSFETAKLLKEKGFECATPHYYYDKDGDLLFSAWRVDAGKNEFVAPTLQMAMKWLREIYRIHVVIYPYGHYSCDNYQFDVYKDNNFVVSKDDGYMTYEQACESAIKYCLKNLI